MKNRNTIFNRIKNLALNAKNYTIQTATKAALVSALAVPGILCGCPSEHSDPAPVVQQQPEPEPEQPVIQMLELEESLKDHFNVLKKTHEPHLLQDFTMSEPAESGTSSVTATQTLEFGSLTPKMAKNNAGLVDVFLHSPANTELYTWKADFQDGVTSKINNGKLDDLIQQDINIGGLNYRITHAETRWIGGSMDEVTIDFLTGKAGLALNDQENTVIRVDEVDYDVTIAGVYTGAQGFTSAQFTVNGETTPNMFTGDTYTLANGQTIGVYETKAGWVEFCLGAQRLRLKDVDINDAEFDTRVSSAGVFGTVTTNTQAKSRITGSVDTTNNTLTLDSLEIAVLSNPTQDTFVAKDHTLSDALDSPAAAIIDVEFHGLETDKPGEPGVPRNYSIMDFNQITYIDTAIGILGSAQRLSFTNHAGDAYTDIPLVFNNGTELSLGGKDGNLRMTEVSSNTDYQVDLDDIIILTKGQDTFVFKYDQFNDNGTNYSIELKDYEDNTVEYTVDSNGTININKGGHTFVAHVDTNTGKMAVDLNGDGVINGASVNILDKYGAELSLHKQDANTVNAVLATNQSRLDSGLEETINLAFEQNNEYITITPDSPTLHETAAGHKKGQSRYGVQFIGYANDDVRLIYPELQEQPNVSLQERN